MKHLLTSLMLLCGLLASAQNNYLLTTDGTKYPIDNPADFESNNSSSGSNENYTFTSNKVENVTLARSAVKSITLEIPLTRASETYFCAYLFYGCTNLIEANITFSGECNSVGDYFCYCMFRDCRSLVSLSDSFNIPQDITSVGNRFCGLMFNGCSSLVSLPDSFNLPEGITGGVSSYFCYEMFDGCSSLISLPDDFNIPQEITSYTNYFCESIFYDCSSLSEGSTVTLVFPFDTTNAFGGTCGITTDSGKAIAKSEYKLKGNTDFYKVKYYDQNGIVINVQVIEKTTMSTIDDFAVTADDLTIEENYVFRYWVDADGARVYETDVIEDNIELYPRITEINEKPNGNSTYEYDLTVDYFYAEDHDCFDYDESGNIVLTVGPEAYVVVETSDGTTNSYYYKEDVESQEITLNETSISKITIYNVADLTFTVDGLNYIINSQGGVYVTGVEDSETNLKLSTIVENDGLTYDVTKILDGTFDGESELTLTVDFDDPEAIPFDQVATLDDDSKLGTLFVEKGSLWDFYTSNWSTYFTITPDVTFTLSDDYGTYTYTVDQTDNAVVLTNFDGDYIIIEEAIENVVEYEGQIFTIKSVANDALTEVVLWVPRDELSVYEQYEDIFAEINGTPDLYIDGIYYNFIYSDDETEELSLKARTVSLEVTNGPEAYEGDITIPETVSVRSVDLGEDAEVTYEVTSLSSTAFKDCTDLTSVTLESSVPLENADALNQVPESCVIVVEDEATRTAYSAILTSVTVYTEEEYKAIVSGITIKVIDKVELERYNLLGQKVNAPVRGINIIKYSDGSVEKVLVK